MTAAQGRVEREAPAAHSDQSALSDEIAFLRSPRMTGRDDAAGHPRHRRVPIILESACEDPAALFALLGEARIASLTGFPEAAIGSFARARPDLQRRFATRLREQLGLTRRQVAAARRVPGDPQLVMRAVGFFATTMRLADTPRVMNRDTMRRLTTMYGEEALSFALVQKPLLAQSIESLREFITEPPISDADKRMFVRALAAHGHEGAPVVALLIDLPVEIATRGFADRFDAVITGLPTLAARALTRVIETYQDDDNRQSGHSAMPSPEDISAAEAQWREDGIADQPNGGDGAGAVGPGAEQTGDGHDGVDGNGPAA
ncbi:MAG: hypothetical protein JJU21_13710 [Salinarimonas sp.]|nr:hypothetical protein [Salinarimonas sp.]